MKTNLYYKLGMIAMYLMLFYSIVEFAVIFSLDAKWWDLMFAALGFVAAPVTGLVLYVRKKTSGLVICGGFSVFLFVGNVISYFIFHHIATELGESTTDILVPGIIGGVLLASMSWLFLSRRVRSVFPDFEQKELIDLVISVFFAAIIIGIITYLPRLADYMMRHRPVLGAAMVFAVFVWAKKYIKNG